MYVQANFAGDAQYKQHLEGPIHRKAMAKAEAQRQRDLQLGAHKGAAESALVRQAPSDHLLSLCEPCSYLPSWVVMLSTFALQCMCLGEGPDIAACSPEA